MIIGGEVSSQHPYNESLRLSSRSNLEASSYLIEAAKSKWCHHDGIQPAGVVPSKVQPAYCNGRDSNPGLSQRGHWIYDLASCYPYSTIAS
jgi:hypothetical protein